MVIHEILEYSLEDLCTNRVLQVLQSGAAGIIPSLGWASGVVFTAVPFPDSDDIIKEKLNGVIHYSAVEYASLPEYRAEVQVRVAASQYPVKVVKVDQNPLFVELGRFLSEKAYKK
jgi:hypothetical protein